MARRVKNLYDMKRYFPVRSSGLDLASRKWPAPGPNRKYTWEKWADGSVWQLSESELKGPGGFRNFRTLLHEWTGRHGLSYQTTVSDDKTKIRFRVV